PADRRLPRILLSAAVVLTLLLLAILHGAATARRILTPGAPVTARSREAILLDRLASPALLWSGPNGRRVNLSGWGLRADEWPDSLEQPVWFDAAPLPPGIVALDLPTEIGLGERLVVAGQLNLPTGDSVWVVLEDPASPRDSVRVGGSSPRFTLGDWPRAATGATYRLRVQGGAGVIEVDTIGVAVRDSRPPTILVIDGSPSFESTFLKRWLAGRGGRVTVRTTISRGKHRVEDPQMTQIKGMTQIERGIGQINGVVLRAYDALLIDGSALKAMGPGEVSAIRNAVAREGLGILVTADPGAAGALDIVQPLLGEAVGTEELSVKPQWRDAPRRSSLPIRAEPLLLGGEVLVRDPQGRALAAVRSAGEGRVGVTLLKAPSRWVLEGEQDLYASYWQLLLSSVARDTVARVAIASDAPRLPNHALEIRVTLPGRNAGRRPVALVESPSGEVDTVPFVQDLIDARQWRTTYWPTVPGWHTLHLLGGRDVPFRVNHPGEWKGLEAS
ncbi:MAG TPA: hypothetical protein VG817_03795, partial [Gemmatimonadales bacterium]|nr:hypothetical protein [Gemmatimonadales bacterium]